MSSWRGSDGNGSASPASRPSARVSRDARNGVVVGVAKAVIGLAVWATGFVAVSDDDFARVVIAEQFAVTPSLDPSGTSWLPAPFWFYGAALMAFGRSLLVARVTAWALGIASMLVVYRSARWLDVAPFGALLGALFASAIPHSAWLGVAPVPEAPAAALILFGACSLATSSPLRRLLGAFALFLATLSRYETWPVAVVFALFCAYDVAKGDRGRRFAFALAGIVSVAGEVAWIAYGAMHHRDALFFVHRVAAYQHALGGAPSTAVAILRYPAALLFAEPEIVALAIVASLASRRSGDEPPRHRWLEYARPAIALAALLAFVAAGATSGSAATHHYERSLLPIWFLMAVFAGDTLASLRGRFSVVWRRPRARVVAGLLLVATVVARVRYPRDSFAARDREIRIGGMVRKHAAEGESVLVDTPDYGFFAVIAAFGRPENAEALRSHDPREQPMHDDSRSVVLTRAAARHARWLIVDNGRMPEMAAQTSLVANSDGLVLLRIK